MSYKLNHLDKVAVSDDYFWQPIDTCPIGFKVLLLSSGTAIIGIHQRGDEFTHWAPLPKIPKSYIGENVVQN